jgi:hypothetical protein
LAARTRKEAVIMYKYFEDKKYLKRARHFCSDLMADLVKELSGQGLVSQFFLVGSGKKNMVTQNGDDGPIDLDYNIEILKAENINDCKSLKRKMIAAFNNILKARGFENVDDSTSSMTTKSIHFSDSPEVIFSIDVAIVVKDEKGNWNRLIHEKRLVPERYYWVIAPDSSDVAEKASDLKENNLWGKVRAAYLEKKNMYLSRGDREHPSFVCYIEAVNETYQKLVSSKN